MKKLVKITATFSHRVGYELSVVESTAKPKFDELLNGKRHYKLYWYYSKTFLCPHFIFKEDLDKIKQECGTWNFIMITTKKNYLCFKKEILETIMIVAKNKLVDCHKNTFIELDSFCKEN